MNPDQSLDLFVALQAIRVHARALSAFHRSPVDAPQTQQYRDAVCILRQCDYIESAAWCAEVDE